MKTTEKILGIIAIAGIILKIAHLPGAGIATVFGLSSLSLFYYFLSFALFNEINFKDIITKASYAGLSAKRIIGTIVLGWSLSVMILGVLFKIQHYPGGKIMMYQGIFFLLICLVVAMIYYNKNKSDRYNKVFSRIAIVGGLGAILLFIL